VVLASSTYGNQFFIFVIVRCADYHPIGIGIERGRLVAASPVMTKSRERPSWGRNNYPENGLVKPPRRGALALCSCPRREDWANTPRREDRVIVIERAAGFGDSPFR
jgi:hypothetical protein